MDVEKESGFSCNEWGQRQILSRLSTRLVYSRLVGAVSPFYPNCSICFLAQLSHKGTLYIDLPLYWPPFICLESHVSHYGCDDGPFVVNVILCVRSLLLCSLRAGTSVIRLQLQCARVWGLEWCLCEKPSQRTVTSQWKLDNLRRKRNGWEADRCIFRFINLNDLTFKAY